MGDLFPTVVYVLCFLTSGMCAGLLGRSYARTANRLLLWSSVCFALLALNNLVVIFDLVLWPEKDFRLLRLVLALAATCSLLWGFVWEVEDA